MTKRFAGLTAVEDVRVRVATGSVHALIGPNGVGKTTVLNCVSGLERPSAGTIALGGRRLDGLAVHQVAEAGVTRTFQNLALFADLSGLDNILVGLHLGARTSLPRALLRTPSVYREEDELRARPRPAGVPPASAMPPSSQRASCRRATSACWRWPAHSRRPRLLLLDEPAAGLKATEVEEIAGLIEQARAAGVTVVIIEHHMDLVMRRCDRVSVLDRGRARGRHPHARPADRGGRPHPGDRVRPNPRQPGHVRVPPGGPALGRAAGGGAARLHPDGRGLPQQRRLAEIRGPLALRGRVPPTGHQQQHQQMLQLVPAWRLPS